MLKTLAITSLAVLFSGCIAHTHLGCSISHFKGLHITEVLREWGEPACIYPATSKVGTCYRFDREYFRATRHWYRYSADVHYFFWVNNYGYVYQTHIE